MASPFFLRILLFFLQSSFVQAIWPIPTQVTTGDETLLLSLNFTITSNLGTIPKGLSSALVRTRAHIADDKLSRLVVDRGKSDLNPSIRQYATLQSLRMILNHTSGDVKDISEEAVVDLGDRDETYSLHIPENGMDATLIANTTLGLLRGLTTFDQLWYNLDGQIYTIGAPLDITDKPVYPYRGLGLDTARNFYPVSDIKRTLDVMSWVKFNTLYWHVVDSQSFPLEVQEFPELAEKGAYSREQIYSEEDVQIIIDYAGERGIDVVLELDTPGHETAIGISHPEHVACYLASPWATYASEPPAGQLRLASESTRNFSVELIRAVSSKFRSSFFSTGGDEVNVNCYNDDAQTQEELRVANVSLDEALNQFILAEHEVIREQGKTPIVKEDMILNHNTTLPKTTIAVVWISSEDAKAVTSKGYRIIHQPSNYFYLDCGAGEWLGDDVPGISWCDPFKTWQRIYSFDPLANLSDTESSLVLGGQIPLWSEQSSPANLDSIVWPRAAAAAEVFWSGRVSNVNGVPTPLNVRTALSRLHEERFRMVHRGVNAIPLQPFWCALRPNECDIGS